MVTRIIMVKSDDRIVIMRTISTINNKSIRQSREVKVRPFPQSGIDKLREWFIDQTWDNVYEAESAHEKADNFHKLLVDKLEEIFPEKTRRINSDDQPWVTFKLKKLDRKRKRLFHKERKSENGSILIRSSRRKQNWLSLHSTKEQWKS